MNSTIAEGFKTAADISLDSAGRILVPDMQTGTVTLLSIDD